MDPRPRNTTGRLQRWNLTVARNYIWAILCWIWKNASAFCSDTLFSKSESGIHTSWIRRQDVLVKIITGAIGLILTCVGLWAAVSAVTEAKTANELAHWTSTKDFMEFCETHNTTNCVGTQNKALPPPPGFSLLSRWRRSLSVNLWGSNSTPEDNQRPSFDIVSILLVVLIAICLWFVIRTGLRRGTYRQFTIASRRALRQLSKMKLWLGNHPAALPLVRQTIKGNTDLTENSDFIGPRHRKPTARRRREARLDRFSRYRTTENTNTVVDDTSSDELYTHGEDTRRPRLRLRRRAKRVVNDEYV